MKILEVFGYTKSNQTTVGSPISWLVGRSMNFDFDWEVVTRAAEKFRRASLVSRTILPPDALLVLAGFGVSIGDGFLTDLAERLRSGDVRKPLKYIESSIRKSCEEHGLVWLDVEEKIKARLRENRPTVARPVE